MFKKRASPGIEPGPLAPETSILPLNYEATFIIYEKKRAQSDSNQ